MACPPEEKMEGGQGDWEDMYLKTALLWVDKPSFVRAFIFSDFKPVTNHPSILAVGAVSLLYEFAMIMYACFFIMTYPGGGAKPWHVFGPAAGCAVLLLGVVNPAFHIVRHQLWQSPMSVKARIAAMPPPVRDQGDDHAKTILHRVAYIGGNLYVGVGVLTFLVEGLPVADMLAALFIRDSLISLVDRWSANRTANTQAEAVILGTFGKHIQFADNCSGDIVLRPSVLKMLQWQDAKIKEQIRQATHDVAVTVTIFDLDHCQPSIVKASGPQLVPVNTQLDLKALAALSSQELFGHVKNNVKDLVKDAVNDNVQGV